MESDWEVETEDPLSNQIKFYSIEELILYMIVTIVMVGLSVLFSRARRGRG